MLERESLGMDTEDSEVVFPSRHVISFMKREMMPHGEARVFCLGMDPSGGGDSSMSCVTVSLMRNCITIVAMDEHPIKNSSDMETMLMTHIETVRRKFPNAWIACFFESNLGQEASHAEAMLLRNCVPRVWCMKERERVGVLTTNSRKELYADNLRHFLEQECIGIMPNMLTGNKVKGEADRVKKILIEQMTNYRRITLEAQPGRIARRNYSGKLAGSRQDDLCLTLQLVSYWAVRLSSQSIPGLRPEMFA